MQKGLTLFLFILSWILLPFNLSAAEQEQDIRKIKVGDLECYELIDANSSLPSKIIQFDAKHANLKKNLPKVFPSVIKTFVVKTKTKIILVDAGCGADHYHLKGQTPTLLAKLHIKPQDVTDILMTHLDIDHQGGLTYKGKAIYPKATLHLADTELQAWVNNKGLVNRGTQNPKYAQATLKVYHNQIKTFKQGDKLFDFVQTIDMSGHTPGHTAYEFTSNNDSLVIAGDFLHAPHIQLAYPELSSIWDAPLAAVKREELLKQLCNTNKILASMHMADIGYVRPNAQGSGYELQVIK